MLMNLYRRKKPVVGETYYIHSEGIVKVTKVGKKYFTVKKENKCNEYVFDKDTFIHNNGPYISNICIYNNKEDYEKSVKAKECETELKERLLRYLTWDEIIELYDKLIERKTNM